MSLVLTSSEMRAWQTCQRGWWLTYYRQLRRQFDMPKLPTVGSWYHRGLERYYNGEEPNPVQFVLDELEEVLEKHPDYADELEEASTLTVIMLEGYFEWLTETGADSNLRIVGAEQAAEVSVGPYKLRGKIDARVERISDDALLQLEHKTVGNFADLPKWARQNPQLLTYDLLALMTKPDGRETDGVLLNMARRVKRTPRAKPPFYERFEVRHTPDELRAHYRHVVGIGEQIEEARKRLDGGEEHHVVCPPAASRSHLWSCSCADLQSMFDDGSDVEAYLKEFYEHADPMERYAPKEEAA